jgi:hypothetical protein
VHRLVQIWVNFQILRFLLLRLSIVMQSGITRLRLLLRGIKVALGFFLCIVLFNRSLLFVDQLWIFLRCLHRQLLLWLTGVNLMSLWLLLLKRRLFIIDPG